MKTAAEMMRACEALQRLEHLTADNWHDMAEADATLVVQLVRTPKLNDEKRGELISAAERLRFYTLVPVLHTGCDDHQRTPMSLGKPLPRTPPKMPEWVPIRGRPTGS